MSTSHTVTIDGAGRLVVPKPLRDELGLAPGQPLVASVRDGRLELVPDSMATELVECDGVLVVTPVEKVEALSRDDVRSVIESIRR